MKRSRTIQLTLVASAAAVLTGCNEQPVRHCVDANNRVVDDRYCGGNGVAGRPGGFVWYYGGPRGYIPMGSTMSGGSLSPQAAPSSSGTSRGVVGHAGEAAAGGAHGGGGGGE